MVGEHGRADGDEPSKEKGTQNRSLTSATTIDQKANLRIAPITPELLLQFRDDVAEPPDALSSPLPTRT